MTKLHTKYIFLFLAGITFLLTGCRSEDSVSPSAFPLPIDFSAKVKDLGNVRTRTLDTVYVASSPYSGNFYIQSNVPGTVTGDTISTIGVYKVPSGYEGTLRPVSTEGELKWLTLYDSHTFYAWTLPWEDENPDYEPSAVSMDIKFHDSGEGVDYETYQNNAVYETFIGTKEGPYDYVNHGKYVEMTFQHLVSKINIEMLAVVETDNSVHKDVVGDITFMGMPSEAKFYPHPDNCRAPYVEASQTFNADSGVTYFIDNKDNNDDNNIRNQFYICPELDFSQIGFKINLNSVEYGNRGDYFGNFNDIEFVRVGEDYDNLDGSDSKVLHAGEMMTLSFILVPGTGPGVSVIIEKWSYEQEENATHHPYPGIYTDAEMQSVLDVFLNQKEYGVTPEVKDIFDVYGEGEGSTDFPLYDNVTLNGAIIPMPPGYTLDGMGHTIYLNSANTGVFGSDPYVNIGEARDLYITYNDYTIYIDPDGNIFTFDNITQTYTQTQYKLEPYSGNQKSYDIDLKTGEVKSSDYYNNTINK